MLPQQLINNKCKKGCIEYSNFWYIRNTLMSHQYYGLRQVMLHSYTDG